MTADRDREAFEAARTQFKDMHPITGERDEWVFRLGWDAHAHARAQAGEPVASYERCPDCNGSGMLWAGEDVKPCPECKGNTVAPTPAQEPVAVPAGECCEDCPPVGYPADRTRCTPCDRHMPDDGTCVRCGSAPRNASGLCATCVDEDAAHAGEVEDDASQALWRQALDQERVPAAPQPGALKRDWVPCPICGEPDMQRETDAEGRSLIRCVNLGCPSNGAASQPSGAVKVGALCGQIDALLDFDNRGALSSGKIPWLVRSLLERARSALAPTPPQPEDFAKGAEAMRARALAAVRAERLDEMTSEPDDVAYERALGHAIQAIAELPTPTQPAGEG